MELSFSAKNYQHKYYYYPEHTTKQLKKKGCLLSFNFPKQTELN